MDGGRHKTVKYRITITLNVFIKQLSLGHNHKVVSLEISLLVLEFHIAI